MASIKRLLPASTLQGCFHFKLLAGSRHTTQSVTVNSWVFFVDGNIFQGSVVAAISQTKVAGVLNGGTTTLPFESGEALNFPTAFVVPGNTASGDFRGYISLHSPEAFGGDGTLQGTPERTDQLIFITDPNTTTIEDTTSGGSITTTAPSPDFEPVFEVFIPGAGISKTDFEFQGTRVFTGTTAAPAATPTPSPTPTSSGAATTTGGTTTTGTTFGTTTGTTYWHNQLGGPHLVRRFAHREAGGCFSALL